MFGYKAKEGEKGTKRVGYERRCEPSPTPKLSLCSLPSKLHESPVMATPPIHTMASVPFQWEEAPGKPRPCGGDTSQPKPRTARCLELPPRMLNEPIVADNLPSPTTVLDGPDYVGLSMSGSSSSGKGRSFDSPENPSRKLSRDRAMLGSDKWGSLKTNKDIADASDSDVVSVSGVGTTVKITRIRRRSSFMNFSPAGSHFLSSIYEGFKQAVNPWRRRQEKLRKKSQW